MNFEPSAYGQSVIARYSKALPIYLTMGLDLTGVTNETKQNKKTSGVPNDVLLFGAIADFNNVGVLGQLQDNGYLWSDELVPVHSFAGAIGQVQPIIYLPVEYLLGSNQQLQITVQNAATSPVTGGKITWVGLRLIQ